jgi:hypothetical protein
MISTLALFVVGIAQLTELGVYREYLQLKNGYDKMRLI